MNINCLYCHHVLNVGDTHEVFSAPPKSRTWEVSCRHCGAEYRVMIRMTADPQRTLAPKDMNLEPNDPRLLPKSVSSTA